MAHGLWTLCTVSRTTTSRPGQSRSLNCRKAAMMLWSLREDDITERCHLFLGEGSRVIEAREDVFTRDGRVCAQQHIHALSVREHPHDLMNRNTHTADAGLAVADFGVNRNTLVHGVKVAE